MTEHHIRYPCPVRRLRVVWRDGKWSVLSEARIGSMTLPASDELPRAGAVSGSWWEVVDGKGRAIYRHRLHDPFAGGVEIFDEGGTITRRYGEAPREVGFDVTVPDIADVAELHFYSSTKPGSGERGTGAAERVAALDVRRRSRGDDGR